MKILDGKALSSKVKSEVKDEALRLKSLGIQPALAVILVGEDKASQTYVNSKEKACNACEIRSIMHRLPATTSESELLALVDVLNLDDSIDGILVQLPLPAHISEQKVIKAISPLKDVDGFHAINTGNLVSGIDGFVPCTPLGIMRMFSEYSIDLTGKVACVIGRSNIVGKPMINLLLNANATVIATHSKTKNLNMITMQADIVVAAIGKPKFVKSDMIKEGAVVIDVGINRLDDGSLVGDVDFENVKDKCSFITPVPGGVGPMTIAMLLSNTIKSAQNRLNKVNL